MAFSPPPYGQPPPQSGGNPPLKYDTNRKFYTPEEEDKYAKENDPIKKAATKGWAVGQGLTLASMNPFLAAAGVISGGEMLHRMKTGKPDDQLLRDDVRDSMWRGGYVGDDWQLKFNDGGSFDIGKDGGAQLTSVSGTPRKYYEIDSSNPLATASKAGVSPLAALVTNNNDILREQFAGYFTNAVTDGVENPAAAAQRTTDLYEQFGITKQVGMENLNLLKQQGRISDEQFADWSQQINQYAPESDTRSPVDAFLPRGSYANKIVSAALAKMESVMGVDAIPYDNIHSFTLPGKEYNDPQYAEAAPATTQDAPLPKPRLVKTPQNV